MTTRVQLKPELLTWAIARNGRQPSDYARRFPKLDAWIAGELSPTFKQVEDFARATNTPMGQLFLPSPPETPLPIHDFRTVSGRDVQQPSPDLLDTIYAMEDRQVWLREHLVEVGAEPLGVVGSARLSDPPEAVGAEMRRIVGIDQSWARRVRTWQEAVSQLRRKIEELGVMTVINGVVGNNTHRKLNVHEFRGFAMADPYAPLIFVNGADAKSAQMFTMAHELAHVWLGEGGLSGFEGLFPEGGGVEAWCNQAAAEFLVPRQILSELWPDVKRQPDRFKRLARAFKVSPIVAARRALDLKLIGRSEFFAFYDDDQSQERGRRSRASGGDFFKSQNVRVGELLGGHVVRAALEGRIGFKEAYRLTGLRGDTFKKYASELEGALW